MFSSRGRLLAVAGGAVGCLLAITAAVSAAGPPTSLQVLLCGTTSGFAAYPQSGNSTIDHPTGLQASGSEYAFTGSNNCQSPGSSTGSFTWSIAKDNVNTTTEHGTEHADAAMTSLAETGSFANGFDGGVFEFDVPTGDAATCGNRSVFYGSGHPFDATCNVGGAPGNFNTEGGASTGNHYNGKYGTLIYQEDMTQVPTTQCPDGGSTYCFQAVIEGQIN